MDWLEPRKNASEKKSDSENSSSNLQPETQENQLKISDDVDRQQSSNHINSEVINNTKHTSHVSQETRQQIKQLCQTADIQLPEKCEIFYYPIEKIRISLGFLKLRSKHELIPNRIGWLIRCLQKEYYFEPENQRALQILGIISKDSPFYEYYV